MYILSPKSEKFSLSKIRIFLSLMLCLFFFKPAYFIFQMSLLRTVGPLDLEYALRQPVFLEKIIYLFLFTFAWLIVLLSTTFFPILVLCACFRFVFRYPESMSLMSVLYALVIAFAFIKATIFLMLDFSARVAYELATDYQIIPAIIVSVIFFCYQIHCKKVAGSDKGKVSKNY